MLYICNSSLFPKVYSLRVGLMMERPYSFLGLLLLILCVPPLQFGCNGDTHCSESELEALLDFKHGLADPESRLSSWKGRNCCQWRGISCDNDTGEVTSIDLHNPYPVSSLFSPTVSVSGNWNLSGEIRPSLLKIKSLQFLDLSLNTFNHIPIPDFLGSLRALKYLNLSKSGFSGEIPANLGNLSSLQVLDVSSPFSSLTVASLDWMSSLVSLKHLSMDGVSLSMVKSNWVRILNMLPHLTEIHLSECDLSGSISSLDPVNFTSLAVLDLSLNPFNSLFPSWLTNISSLSYIDLSNCNLFGRIPLGLSELPNLEHLNLAMNNNLSASCFQLFQGSWRNIKVLDFAINKLHGQLPSSIGNMSLLTDLSLFENRVEGGIPNSIGKLCNLEKLDLSGNNLTGTFPEKLDGTSCVSGNPLSSLMYLRLTGNQLAGNLPEWLGRLENLVELTLDDNLLQGPIPASVGNLRNLTNVGLSSNLLNGTLPDSFGQLSQLTILDVSFNDLSGFITETHFFQLLQLKFLHLTSNSFIFNVSSDWIPPFQIQNLDIGSCNLGPTFPPWLRTQKHVMFLDISNASISDTIPDWFWDISSNFSLLNASFNQLHGKLPNPLNVAPFADVDFSSNSLEGPIPLPIGDIELLDLSNNRFSGPIPENLAESMPYLIFLSLAGNRLTGAIPPSIGEMMSLLVIDLSNNSLTGRIPPSIGNCSFLKAADFSYNNLSGAIPESFGQLLQLQTLHLSQNNLTGSLPSPFQNLASLETLDLASNRLSGNIPHWIGDSFASLRILSLRSNAFSGEIPTSLSNLSSLQVLDLAQNNLTGTIPVTFGDLKAMSQDQYRNQYLFYGNYRGLYYEEGFVVNIKGGPQKYTKTLSLITSIDLSGNNLTGEFPEEITKLIGLSSFNLSNNQISGQIPTNIADLHQLSSLDLSSNNFSGEIPPTMISLSFLSYLNLSNNNFSGSVPYTGQMSTFDASAFAGNPGLCGPPLVLKCQGNDSNGGGGISIVNEENDGLFDNWFYMSVGLGFAAGILVPMLMLGTRKHWQESYFGLVDKIVEKISAVRTK